MIVNMCSGKMAYFLSCNLGTLLKAAKDAGFEGAVSALKSAWNDANWNDAMDYQCVSGAFAEAGSTQCTPCPPGFACPSTEDSSVMIACAPGTYAAGGAAACAACPAGTFGPDAAAYALDACEACPAGTFSAAAAATSAATCLACPEDTFCDAAGTTEPAACPAGTGTFGKTGVADAAACARTSSSSPPPPPPRSTPPTPASPPPPPLPPALAAGADATPTMTLRLDGDPATFDEPAFAAGGGAAAADVGMEVLSLTVGTDQPNATMRIMDTRAYEKAFGKKFGHPSNRFTFCPWKYAACVLGTVSSALAYWDREAMNDSYQKWIKHQEKNASKIAEALKRVEEVQEKIKKMSDSVSENDRNAEWKNRRNKLEISLNQAKAVVQRYDIRCTFCDNAFDRVDEFTRKWGPARCYLLKKWKVKNGEKYCLLSYCASHTHKENRTAGTCAGSGETTTWPRNESQKGKVSEVKDKKGKAPVGTANAPIVLDDEEAESQRGNSASDGASPTRAGKRSRGDDDQRDDTPSESKPPSGKRMCTCEKQRRFDNCKTCNPCPHGRLKHSCATCNPCPHGKLKHSCKTCNPCPHGKLKYDCKECNPCPHGELKRYCKECDATPACQATVQQTGEPCSVKKNLCSNGYCGWHCPRKAECPTHSTARASQSAPASQAPTPAAPASGTVERDTRIVPAGDATGAATQQP